MAQECRCSSWEPESKAGVRVTSGTSDRGIDKNFHPATKAHPGLLVADLQVVIERCRERGLAIIDDAPIEGYLRIFVNDPFGNRLELMQKV
jgi:hypothetical protein